MKIFIDGHCDTIEKALDANYELTDKRLNFNLEDAKKLDAPIVQMTAAYVSPKYHNSFERAKNILQYFEKQNEKHKEKMRKICNIQDIEETINNKKIGCMLTIENGSAIEDNLANVDYFKNLGVKMMSITWNEDNLLGSGAHTKQDNGLTKFGKQYIKKLNKNNIIVDVSHSSPKTFWDSCKITNHPIVASHSCCYSLCNHPRNLQDDQIKQIAKMQGIVGICYCNQFLRKKGIASTKDIVAHICYVVNLVGIDYVGVGSDFDGLEPEDIPRNLTSVKQLPNLIEELEKKGFSQKEIDKILGENWLRLLKRFL